MSYRIPIVHWYQNSREQTGQIDPTLDAHYQYYENVLILRALKILMHNFSTKGWSSTKRLVIMQSGKHFFSSVNTELASSYQHSTEFYKALRYSTLRDRRFAIPMSKRKIFFTEIASCEACKRYRYRWTCRLTLILGRRFKIWKALTSEIKSHNSAEKTIWKGAVIYPGCHT